MSWVRILRRELATLEAHGSYNRAQFKKVVRALNGLGDCVCPGEPHMQVPEEEDSRESQTKHSDNKHQD